MTSTFPAPTYVQTNGIRMAVNSQGDPAKPAVILSHGFPELAYSWRHQLKPLADAGFFVLAPDQRGYGLTTCPDRTEDFDMRNLTDDLLGLMDAYQLRQAVFAGHDWGGFIVWSMAQMHPDRVAGVIGLNTPYLPRAPMDPIALMRAAYGEKMYIVKFQTPGLAEEVLNKDVAKTLRFFYRRSGITQEEFAKYPPEARRFQLLDAVQSDESGWTGQGFLSGEEMAFYRGHFERTGFSGGVQWYRNFTRNWLASEGLDPHLKMPCLMISADNDLVLPPSLSKGMEDRIANLERALITDSGHWTQQEQPEQTNRAMITWLTKHFG